MTRFEARATRPARVGAFKSEGPIMDWVQAARTRGGRTWPLTPSMASVKRPPRGPRGQPARASHVDNCRIRAQEHPGHARIACEALHRKRADRPGALEHPGGSTGSSDQGFESRGHLQVWTLTTDSGQWRRIEAMPREFDERIGVTPIPRSIVVASGPSCERIERGTQRCTTHRVEKPLDENRAAFTGPYLQRPVFDILQLLGLERLGVVRVARVSTVGPETIEAVAHGLVKERPFLECGSSRGCLKRPRGPGHQREMSKTEPSLLDGRNTLVKRHRL
jgi:8-oxo-dGTP pyrophosphatase MutT (NUDIX family)